MPPPEEIKKPSPPDLSVLWLIYPGSNFGQMGLDGLKREENRLRGFNR